MSRQARLEKREFVRIATVGRRERLVIVRVRVKDGQLHVASLAEMETVLSRF
jgi:hypothetical protein